MLSPRRTRIGASLTEVFQSPSKLVDVKAGGEFSLEFYAVVLPRTTTLHEQDEPPFVFTDLPSTIQFCKRYKDTARWKKFSSRQEAEQFCENFDALAPASQANPSSKEERRASGERSPFKSPRSQDYVHFRKCIMEGEKNLVLNLVWSNPRYLIGGGDNPTILHEGCRYNAFHIAARCNKPEMLEILLSLLRNESLFRMLYPDDDDETTRQRIKYVINMYLNIPDKTKRGDRPLHFASALGFINCVEVLINQQECVRDAPNGEGFTPVELAGSRVKQKWPCDAEKAIIEMFNDHQVIIPIYRDNLCVEPPTVGSPISLISNDFDFRNPPKPHSHGGAGDKSQFHIVAYVGPLTKEHSTKITDRIHKTRARTADVRRRDAEKGLEIAVRNIAKDNDLRWNEFWPFLDEWGDLATRNGILKFEEYFAKAIQEARSDSTPENQNANNKRITKEHATASSIKAIRNVVDGLGVDHYSVQSLEKDLIDADHDEVARVTASYVLEYMSLHERKYVFSELKNLEGYPLDDMKSCVMRMIYGQIEGTDPADCNCHERKAPQPRQENNCDSVFSRQKSKPSSTDIMQICFIHGPVPTKTDYQVWTAMGSVAETIEQHYFPCVYRWINNMSDFPDEQMAHWATPKKTQRSPLHRSPQVVSLANQQMSTTPLRPSRKGNPKTSRNPRRAGIIPTDEW